MRGGLGKRQIDILTRTIEVHRKLGRPLGASDLGATTAVERGKLYQVWNSLKRRGFLTRVHGEQGSTAPTPGAMDALDALRRRAAGEPMFKAPAKIRADNHRTWFNVRVAPDDTPGSIYPAQVQDPDRNPFQPGSNSPKLGEKILHGRWAGMTIYSLALEERRTCPETCAHWADCYTNNSPQLIRFRHGPELLDRIRAALWDFDRLHPDGYVVRLHVAGDFYSVFYVMFWKAMLVQHPACNVWGYTARDPFGEIGRLIHDPKVFDPSRWSVRDSTGQLMFSAPTIYRHVTRIKQPEGLVCPEQLGRAKDCASCAICWESRKPVAFMSHAFLGGDPNG